MTVRLTTRAALAAAAIIALPVGEVAATGDALDAEMAARKISYADRQRMLSQRVVGAACLKSMGVVQEDEAFGIEGSLNRFSEGLEGLMNGSETLDLPFESDTSARAALEALESAWAGLETLTSNASHAVPTTAQLKLIADAEPPVQAAAEAVVAAMRQGAGSVPFHKAIALDVAGRQRMLSQRMLKHACLAAAGVESEANLAALKESVGLFEMTLGALIDGFEGFGLQPASAPEEKASLAELAAVWAAVKPAYEEFGGNADAATIAVLADKTEALLKAAIATAAVYEAEAAMLRTN